MRANPMTYATSGIRDALYGTSGSPVPAPSITVDLLVLTGFALTSIALATVCFYGDRIRGRKEWKSKVKK